MQNYNIILDTVDISTESGPVSEPVTLSEMKNYLRLEGFIDDNDSTALPGFEDDDDIIEELITNARQTLEEELNCSIISHTWQAIGVTNQAGMVQLRYGPVQSIESVLDSEDEEYDTDDVKNVGDYLKFPRGCEMTVEYTAGFDTVPKAIITEIKRMVAYMYENRGDEDGLEGYQYTPNVMKYSRRSPLA